MSLVQGDARQIPLADASVQCVVTSPPYWGLRDYKLEPSVWDGAEGCAHEWGDGVRAPWANSVPGPNSGGKNDKQRNRGKGSGSFCQLCGAWRGCLGLEPTPDLYVQHLVDIFREVRRVLRNDGTAWLNLGDSYVSTAPGTRGDPIHLAGVRPEARRARQQARRMDTPAGLKPKDLVGIPWMVAFALRADGWYLRADIVWAKGYSFHPTTAGSCMPESVTDRPTRSHEYLFLLTKSAHYYYDADAVKEQASATRHLRASKAKIAAVRAAREAGANTSVGIGRSSAKVQSDGWVKSNHSYENAMVLPVDARNLRSVWLINPAPFKGAHFATFPPALVEPCLKAGSRPGDLVLDPFGGAGTVALVARSLGRRACSLDRAPHYQNLARQRRRDALGLFA